MNSYHLIRRAVRSTPWAIQPEKLEAILAFLQLKAEGKAVDAVKLAEIHAASEVAAARATNVSGSSKGSVAVLPVYGCIMHRGNMMGDISGPSGTSIDQLTSQFRQALNDPSVSAIVFDFDSPGGTVDGVAELASEILAARGKKKITAVSDCLCASAAYWLASACTDIVVSPSSLTGSIGVYSAHEDDSEYLAKEGVKVTLISYGENKTQGNPYEPLSDSARGNMQAMVNDYGAMFDKAVAKGRKISAAKVSESFGQGLCFTAQQAVKIGMADSVGTLDDVLARYGVSRGRVSAALDRPEVHAEETQEISAEVPVAEDPDLVAVAHAAMKRRLEIGAA